MVRIYHVSAVKHGWNLWSRSGKNNQWCNVIRNMITIKEGTTFGYYRYPILSIADVYINTIMTISDIMYMCVSCVLFCSCIIFVVKYIWLYEGTCVHLWNILFLNLRKLYATLRCVFWVYQFFFDRRIRVNFKNNLKDN